MDDMEFKQKTAEFDKLKKEVEESIVKVFRDEREDGVIVSTIKFSTFYSRAYGFDGECFEVAVSLNEDCHYLDIGRFKDLETAKHYHDTFVQMPYELIKAALYNIEGED